ncbi:DDE-type integrase/transposase/recombinase [Psychroserpens sp.]|uniref:DDE-type integrase/transposase/recombinase n=1 Tax=Psychroserpens sp. TaxID=2020870 RepID=UPI002B2663C1|nr:DDE-type integrase/transposase/recombinase [Psychroserpens sp.]
MRISWDTSIKHLARHGLLKDILTSQQVSNIPSSNLSRWKNESDDKYLYSEINQIIKKDIELIKRINQTSRIKKINEAYFKLADTFHFVISNIKGVKTLLKNQKELLVNTINSLKNIIPIDNALKLFNISRTTYQNYKTIVIHKCEASYFKWCNRRFSNQLLPKEVEMIKEYMEDERYRDWSKSCIYLRAIRDNSLFCGLSTFYKYCRLLGFSNLKNYLKSKRYNPHKTSRPNGVWCADVTIFRTEDYIKHYIHILMDHYSKKIIDYRIENSCSGKAIRSLLQVAYKKYKPINTMFLTDGGSENVNRNVASLLKSYNDTIIHRIAQRDVIFSNSMIEAFNKVLKHQFLYPRVISNRTSLEKVMTEVIPIYNNERPQLRLGGNTPNEIFDGSPIQFGTYSNSFKIQKALRIIKNKQNICNTCL